MGETLDNRQGEVVKQFALLEEAISGTVTSMEMLTNQLGPILSRPINDKPAQVEAPEPSLCDVANGIRSQMRRVEMLHRGIESLAHRIQV